MSEIIRVGFGGVTMDTSDRLSADGEMEVLDNLRHRSGSLIPFAPNPLEYSSDLEIVYIHENMGYEHWIGYDERVHELYYEAYRNEYGVVVRNEGSNRLIGRLGGVMLSVSSIGHVLVVNADGGNFYAIWKDGVYNETSIPELPNIEVTISNHYSHGDYYNTGPEIPLEEYYSNGYKDALRAKVAEFLSGNNKIFYPILVRVAFETISGYVNHSAIFSICSEYPFREDGDLVNMRHEDDRSTSTSIMCLLGVRGKTGSQSGIVANIRERFRSYSFSLIIPPVPENRLVTALVVSVSKQLYKLSDTAWHHKMAEYTWHSAVGDRESMVEAITLTNNGDEYGNPNFDAFYIVKKIPIAELKNGKTVTFEDVDFSDSSLAIREVLPDYYGNRDGKSYKNLFKYNNRLHGFGLAEKMFSGFLYNDYTVKQSKFNGTLIPVEASAVKKVQVSVKIKTDIGDVVVERTDLSARSLYYSPFVSYPDRRAKEMYFIYTMEYSGVFYTRRALIPLTAHPSLNLAYYCNPTFTPHELKWDSGVPGEFMSEMNSITKQNNLFHVSENNNPLVFPVENEFSAGDGDVIGLGVANADLSEGRFGQFPLYVFTNEGIWMMQQGTGDVVYESAQPMSREVCINGGSITSLDNAVAFATDKGLMVVSGSTVEDLSHPLRSDKGEVRHEEFRDWIGFWRSAKIGYNYQEAEICVSGGDRQLGSSAVWVYGLRSKAWKRRVMGSEMVRGFVGNYPELYSSRVAIETGHAPSVQGAGDVLREYRFYNESRAEMRHAASPQDGGRVYVPFSWRTRPMKLGSTQLKKLVRSVVRMTMNGWGRLRIYGCSSVEDDGGRIASRKLMYEALIAKGKMAVETETEHAPSVRYMPISVNDIRSRVLGCGFRYWVVEMSGECAVGETWFDFLEIETQGVLGGKLR